MSASKCACDVCEVVFGIQDARTPDGYCAFCAMSCFPPGTIAGKQVRMTMSRDSREHLHAAARVAKHLPHDPMRAIDSARQETAEAVVRVVGPVLEREGRALLNKLKRKIAGR